MENIKHSFPKSQIFINKVPSFIFIHLVLFAAIHIRRMKSLLKQLSLVLAVTLLQRLFTASFLQDALVPLAVTGKPMMYDISYPSLKITYLDQRFRFRVSMFLWKIISYLAKHLSTHFSLQESYVAISSVSLFQKRKMNHGTFNSS